MLISSLFLLFPHTIKNNFYSINIKEEASVTTSNQTSTLEIGNQISNGYALQPIRKMIQQADSSLTIIKVFHIGDSHIKSGYFSQPFMEKLNTYYAQQPGKNVFFNFQVFCKTGTKYSDYTGLAELDYQLMNEKFDLVIVSLGTNDAFSGSARTRFYEKVDHLVTKIKTLSPQASILLTTPSDGLKYNKAVGTYTALPDLENVVNTLVQYAHDHDIAYWNLHRIMGGTYSINNWLRQKLAATDRVHYTAKGYNIFAGWLFKAFIACMENSLPSNSPS